LVKFADFYPLFIAIANYRKDIAVSLSIPYIALTNPLHQRISLGYEL